MISGHSSGRIYTQPANLGASDDLRAISPITHSYPHAFTMESSFQSSKPPTSSDTSRLGCAARFNLSAMDLPVSMNGRFQVPLAAGQLLSSARTADLSKDKEIFDSDDDDNDLPSVKQ